jgi:hypothetical protein
VNLPDIIREIRANKVRWAGYIACMGKVRSGYKIIFGKLQKQASVWRTTGI